MRYTVKNLMLRDGCACLLRSPEPEDAEEILRHLRQTSGETKFLSRYDDEFRMSVADEVKFLKKTADDPKSMMIAAFSDGRIAATAGFSPVAPYERYRHRAEFGISVKKEYWNRGIGSVVLQEIIRSARAAGYEFLELEVVTENERAVRLYQKYGFICYGTREKSFRYRDGSFGAEHLMRLAL